MFEVRAKSHTLLPPQGLNSTLGFANQVRHGGLGFHMKWLSEKLRQITKLFWSELILIVFINHLKRRSLCM